MQIFLGIITSLIIGYTRVRLIDRAFSHREIKFHLSLKMSLHGLLLVTMLFFYQYFLQKLGRDTQYFLDNFKPTSIILFIAYCTIIIAGLTFLYHNFSKKKFIKNFITGTILFLLIGLGGFLLGINIIIMYYILSAYAEEYLKFGTGNNIFLGEKETKPTDLILFSIMIGLGFSGIENLFFVGQNIRNARSTGTTIVSSGILSTGRGLISTLIHVVSTGLIAYTLLYFQKKQHKTKPNNFTISTLHIIFPILLGVGLHTIFNLSLHFSLKILLIPLIILCYFLLTFLLFKSDRLYNKKQ